MKKLQKILIMTVMVALMVGLGAIASSAAARLESRGLIDEERDVRREVEKCLRKCWGEKRIRAHLWGRGFGAEAISSLPEVFAEVNFVKNCAALIRKHYGQVPSDPTEQKRMIAFLSRYGYSLGEIRTAMRQ